MNWYNSYNNVDERGINYGDFTVLRKKNPMS